MKVSIITVCFNDLNGLQRTIKSVSEQTFSNFEHVIIDGGSTDGSVEYLKRISIKNVKYISEVDEGIYFAMNKGLKIICGDWVIFLNSGDTFDSKETLECLEPYLINRRCVYFGRANIIASENMFWIYPPKFVNINNVKYWLTNNLPNHQAIFFPKHFYENNTYRVDLKISADSDYKERALKICEFHLIDLVISNFNMDGLSSKRDFHSQFQQIKDRFNRLSSPTKYIDLLSCVPNAIIKYLFFKFFDMKSYLIINYIKSLKDFILIFFKKLYY